MSKRTHSTVDGLPADLRSTLMRMIVDGYWPDGFERQRDGKPTYDDMVEYVVMQGYSIARSSLNRWGQRLNAMELLRDRAEIVRNVMTEGESPEDFADAQRATADLINARILEAAMSGKLSSKETRELAAAAKDCMRLRIDNDQYRQKITERVKTAAANVEKKLNKTGMDRKKVQEIIDEFLGITS